MISPLSCSCHLYICHEISSQRTISGFGEQAQSKHYVHRACDWTSIDNLVVCRFQTVQCPGRQLSLCHPGITHHDLGCVVATFARLERRRVGILSYPAGTGTDAVWDNNKLKHVMAVRTILAIGPSSLIGGFTCCAGRRRDSFRSHCHRN
jgi:hypothetical protein